MRITKISADTIIKIMISYQGVTIEKETFPAEEQAMEDALLIYPLYDGTRIIGIKNKGDISIKISWTQDNAVWEIKNPIIDTVLYKRKYFYRIMDTEEAIQINRRGAYREFLGTMMKISSPNNQFEPINIYVKDISETGFSFITDKDFKVKEILVLRLFYFSTNEILPAIIVRRQENENDFTYGCRFIRINKDMGQIMAKIQREKRFELLNKKHHNIGYK